MIYVITELRIKVRDKGCIDVCPMDCIPGTDDDQMRSIDPRDCMESERGKTNDHAPGAAESTDRRKHQ